MAQDSGGRDALTNPGISDFAQQFIWALIAWNEADLGAQLMLAHMLGGTRLSLAVAADLGTRNVLEGIESAFRELRDQTLRDHATHFLKGYRIIQGYRNLYVHNLRQVALDDVSNPEAPLSGIVVQVKSAGRLRMITMPLTVAMMGDFRSAAETLSIYTRDLLEEVKKHSFEGTLRVTQPTSLQKPQWPAGLQNNPEFLQPL